jgi:hypothetical protein
MAAAISKYRQNALTSCICLGVRHSASKIAGDPTNTQIAFAREVATFSRFELNRNSMPCGAYVTGRRNGIDHERRFLTLEFIDRADPAPRYVLSDRAHVSNTRPPAKLDRTDADFDARRAERDREVR